MIAAIALIISGIALIISIHLTGWSNDVANAISENERRNAREQRCVDSLIELRGALGELRAGYNLRPLARDDRLKDWTASARSLDTVTLACSADMREKSRPAQYYAALVSDFSEDYIRAPSGDWDACTTDHLYELAGFLTLSVMRFPNSDDNLNTFVNDATECGAGP